MKAYFKKIAALTAAALLVLSMAACGGNDEEPTESDTANAVVDEVTPGDTSASEDASADASENASEGASEDGTEAADSGDTDETKATAPSANASSWTKAQVVEYYNAAANKVKTEKPAVKKTFTQTVGKIDVGNSAINSMAESLSKELVPAPETTSHAKGSNLNSVFPVSGQSYGSKLTANDVASFSIKDNGSTYSITLVIVTESFTSKLSDVKATAHGRCMTYLTPNDILDQVDGISAVEFKSFKSTNSGSKITCTIDKASGSIKNATFSDNVDLDLTVKVLGLTKTAKINIKTTEEFTMS